jgi:hypothetical protein
MRDFVRQGHPETSSNFHLGVYFIRYGGDAPIDSKKKYSSSKFTPILWIPSHQKSRKSGGLTEASRALDLLPAAAIARRVRLSALVNL